MIRSGDDTSLLLILKQKNMMVKTNSLKAWFLAARPKTLSAAAVPVMLGTALAYKDSSANCQWVPALLCLLFAWVMQIDSNFVNDYFDFKRGNDDETRLGPKRACAEGWITERAMKTGIIVTTLLGCAIGLPLVIYGGMAMIWVGVACVAFCFLYTTTFSYHGMGDILVLLFFGIVPVCCTYYVIMPEGYKTVSTEVGMAAIACGLVVDTLLVVNNFRDRDNDREAGKRTLIVKLIDRWDEKSALWLYLLLGYVPLAIMMGMGIHDAVVRDTSTFALPLYAVYAGMHHTTYRQLKAINHGRELNRVLGSTARNIFIYGQIVFLTIVLGFALEI